jgi:hypothetical protein
MKAARGYRARQSGTYFGSALAGDTERLTISDGRWNWPYQGFP